VRARIALAVTALALIGAAPAAGAPFSSITGFSIASSGPFVQTQTGKLQPSGGASSCNSPKTAPAVDPGTFNILSLGDRSSINEPTCVTVTYSTANSSCQTNGLFSTTYLDDFNRSQVAANYLGDVGSAPTTDASASYSVVVPGGRAFTVAWNMSVAGTGCAAFDTTLSADRPWALVPPPVSGHPFVGETLTSIDTQWNGAPSFTRQWRRCAANGSACVDIPGATATTYTPGPDDVGRALRVRVAATESGVTSTADSDRVPIGIQFDAANGQSLGTPDPAQNGRLNRTVDSSACGAKKAAPQQTDLANTRFYDVFRHTNASESTICTLVSLEQLGACSPSTDRTFSAAYLPAFDPAAVRTNYLADGAVSGRTGTLTHRYGFDVPAGAAYDVVVTSFAAAATCPGYDLRFGTASPYPTGTPSVEGTAQAGQTLTAVDGPWTGTPTFGHQWQRCFGDGTGCADIPGATARTLALASRNVGDSFRVRVTATQGLGSASKTSAPSGAVAEAPPEPPPPGPPDPPAYAGIALKPVTKVVGSKGLVTLSLACPAGALLGCVGTDVVRLGKATLALKPFAMGPGKTAKVSFTLSKRLRKRLVKQKRLNATQIVNSFDSRGVPVRTSAKLTLKPKPKKRR
jgi:hypothetical protein